MGFLDNAPPCDRAVCFAYADGGCRVLTDTHFKCGCPFFKDAEAKKAEDVLCSQRAEMWKTAVKSVNYNFRG